MTRRAALGVVSLLPLLTLLGLWVLTPLPPQAQPRVQAVLPEDVEGHIIALDTQAPHVRALVEDAATHLMGGRRPRVWRAVNGSEAMASARLPLYTRLTLASGRHDHMQLGSPSMLGCLLSHVAIWHAVVDAKRASLVLEEDAQLDAVSATRLEQLLIDVRNASWDVLLLETGHLTVSGATRAVGELGRTWADPEDALHNRWMGTRGYLLTPQGAAKLLTRADELGVQVDALLGMAVVFDGLRMVWTSANIAHPTHWRPSAVQTWDPCLKCFAPIDSRLLLALLVAAPCAVALFFSYLSHGKKGRLLPPEKDGAAGPVCL
jgi:GR25 family glycosyltransferase involved in LPS biosynthesis